MLFEDVHSVTQPDLWRGTIRMLESRIDHFETLVEQAADQAS